MLSATEGILLLVITTESLLGVLGNAFFGLLHCIDWLRKKKFSKIGLILTGLVISRIVLILIIISDAYIRLFFPQLLASGNLTEFMNYSWIIINHMSIWFATILSVFYFFKIAYFSHHIFHWLKSKTDAIFILLIGCLFVSWIIAISLTAKIVDTVKMQYGNTSWQLYLWKSQFFIYHVFVDVGVFFFFTIALITCSLLIISLWRHKRQMQSTVSGCRDLNTEAHVKAVKVLISFFILFIVYLIGLTIERFAFMLENKLLFFFGLATTSLCPCCHSLILIAANSQIRRASLRALQLLKCCKKGSDLSGT